MSDDGYFGLISAEADRWASSFMADRKADGQVVYQAKQLPREVQSRPMRETRRAS